MESATNALMLRSRLNGVSLATSSITLLMVESMGVGLPLVLTVMVNGTSGDCSNGT